MMHVHCKQPKLVSLPATQCLSNRVPGSRNESLSTKSRGKPNPCIGPRYSQGMIPIDNLPETVRRDMKSIMLSVFCILSACTHTTAASKDTTTAAKSDTKEHFKEGWKDVKEGGKEVASGVAEGAKKAGTAIHSVACPIAVNKRTGLYYAKDSRGYEEMLGADQSENRECFMSETAAREKGYRLVK